MEINKQLFEDILSGKLKGTFVLKNKQIVKSNTLKRSSVVNFPYQILVEYGNGVTDYGMYKSNGDFETFNTSYFDIIDFIPDTNMRENELTIEIPENQEIDWQESAKQEKIVFKKKDTKPRSWEEYCKNHKGDFYFITSDSNISGLGFNPRVKNPLDVSASKNTLPSKELAEAFLAMMQLMSLRQAWIGDWEPDWMHSGITKWCIYLDQYIFEVGDFSRFNHVLSFPTKEMAEDFINTFKDLLETAKPLI